MAKNANTPPPAAEPAPDAAGPQRRLIARCDCYCHGRYYEKGTPRTFHPGELIPEHFTDNGE